MNILRAMVLVLVFAEAGWMVFDGSHALITGDYTTPTTGAHAGELGPWAAVVSAAGIEPRSTLMKVLFVGYGTLWLVFAGAFAMGARWAWWTMVIGAVASLWYLPLGTGASVLQLLLLMTPQVRQ